MFSNVQAKGFSRFLFAHTNQFQVDDAFSNRTEEQKELTRFLDPNRPVGTVVILSDFYGAGKTWLLNKMKGHLVQQGLLDDRDRARLHLSVRMPIPEPGLSRILILDDMDAKSSGRGELLAHVGAAAERLGQGFDFLLVAGDRSLRDHTDLRKALSGASSVEWVPLAPLSPTMLVDAIRLRLSYSADTRAYAEEADDMFSSDLLAELLPNTTPPVATFRGTLSILTQIVASHRAIPPNYKPFRLTAEACAAWLESQPSLVLDRSHFEFLSAMREYVLAARAAGEELRALPTTEWRANCPVDHVVSDQQYEDSVLEPLSKGGLLQADGIPWVDGTGGPRKFAGPYLPSVSSLLRIAYDDNWP